jgi:predicted aspartyl protease
MTTEIPFDLQEGFIIVEVVLNLYREARLVLDTGCTQTVIHTTEAQKLGFNLKKASKIIIETGSKPEYAKEINLTYIEALGHTIENMPIAVFDVNVELDNYVGYLGLDFFKGKCLTIDFDKQLLWIA